MTAAPSPMKFMARMQIRDGNPYIPISATRAKRIKPGWRKPLPVLVRVNGKPRKAWRINMMPAGDGSFYLYLHGIVRKASATGVGDRVAVEVAFDETYHGGPMHPMPRWFATALRSDATAKKNWDKLTPSRRKEVVRYLSSLKTDEAKQRNLAKVMRVLGGKSERFMARTWKEGR